jgi:hypothetical protein
MRTTNYSGPLCDSYSHYLVLFKASHSEMSAVQSPSPDSSVSRVNLGGRVLVWGREGAAALLLPHHSKAPILVSSINFTAIRTIDIRLPSSTGISIGQNVSV